jgi:hypothetical protein
MCPLGGDEQARQFSRCRPCRRGSGKPRWGGRSVVPLGSGPDLDWLDAPLVKASDMPKLPQPTIEVAWRHSGEEGKIHYGARRPDGSSRHCSREMEKPSTRFSPSTSRLSAIPGRGPRAKSPLKGSSALDEPAAGCTGCPLHRTVVPVPHLPDKCQTIGLGARVHLGDLGHPGGAVHRWATTYFLPSA